MDLLKSKEEAGTHLDVALRHADVKITDNSVSGDRGDGEGDNGS